MRELFEFVANTADGVFAVNRHQRIVLWNRAAEGLLGIPATRAVGRPCYEVIGGSDELGCRACRLGCRSLKLAMRSELVATREVAVHSGDNGERWISLSTILVPTRLQHLAVLIHLFRDITRHKTLEQGVRLLLEKLPGLPCAPVVGESTASCETHGHAGLTRREQEVLRNLASGAPTREIATSLYISPATVRNHVHNIFEKLGVHSRLEAVTVALGRGLLGGERAHVPSLSDAGSSDTEE
jgi:PAS domain S-box-containing protein